MLFGILLVAQVLICAVMGGLILIQRSEGGALGMGGGPSGFMSARGAGNLLTKLTWGFAALLFANSLGMTVVGNLDARTTSVTQQVDASKLPAAPLAPAQAAAPAAASTSSAPSLNDLPLASTPNAPASGLSTLPVAAPSSSAAPVAAPKMPKPLNPAASAPVAPHPATTHLPSALGSTSVSVAPLGSSSKTSHSATPNLFPSSSSQAPTPSSSASTTPSSTPTSSQ